MIKVTEEEARQRNRSRREDGGRGRGGAREDNRQIT